MRGITKGSLSTNCPTLAKVVFLLALQTLKKKAKNIKKLQNSEETTETAWRVVAQIGGVVLNSTLVSAPTDQVVRPPMESLLISSTKTPKKTSKGREAV